MVAQGLGIARARRLCFCPRPDEGTVPSEGVPDLEVIRGAEARADFQQLAEARAGHAGAVGKVQSKTVRTLRQMIRFVCLDTQ